MTDEWNIWESEHGCPVCHSEQFVPPSGNRKSDILLVGEMPGSEELEKGIPMVGPMGTVLRTELAVLGHDLRNFRRMNVWFHPPNKNIQCFEYGVQQVIKEAKDKRIILLMGDEVVLHVPDEIAEDVKVFTKNTMEMVAEQMCPGVPFIADVCIGNSWADKS